MQPSAPVTAHERHVERLYARGVENYGDYGAGYLNFGLWENGEADYVRAAERLVHRIGELLGLAPGARVLDAAPGMGSQDLYLDVHFGPLEVDAVDITRLHVEHGRRKAAAAGVTERLRFHHASATRLPFAERSFTHALSLEAAHHFDTRGRFFEEVARVLAPGGVLAMADFVLAREPRTAWQRALLDAACRLWRVPNANVDTLSAYCRRLEAAGFAVTSVEDVSERTFPGYYREQCRPERRREVARIRGFVGGRIGHVLNIAIHAVHTARLVDYVLVRAERRA